MTQKQLTELEQLVEYMRLLSSQCHARAVGTSPTHAKNMLDLGDEFADKLELLVKKFASS